MVLELQRCVYFSMLGSQSFAYMARKLASSQSELLPQKYKGRMTKLFALHSRRRDITLFIRQSQNGNNAYLL